MSKTIKKSSVIDQDVLDVFVIGGGVNGCGIARDAAGRGLKVALAEKSDIGGATSSASTKMFHGGLRYLEYFKIRLVKEALIEREILLKAMPHISWPMRFILPHHKDMRFEGETSVSKLLKYVMPWLKGRRPSWLIRIGLFFYDHLGGRKILPPTRNVDLRKDDVGKPLKNKYEKAYEYSDCWVQDSRLVVLNARDAEIRGAKILPRCEVISAIRKDYVWEILVRPANDKPDEIYYSRTLVNASGPWVEKVIKNVAYIKNSAGVRMVRGSHIVTKKIFDHDKAYFLQGSDGRIIFAIPYEEDFTLIGTTDHDYNGTIENISCTDEESKYLCDFASNYFETPITEDDVIWSFSGVRPLYNDGASSATSATRDYVLILNHVGHNPNHESYEAPLLNIFGGKITTYRRLAEAALDKLAPFFPNAGRKWTSKTSLPGGDFEVHEVKFLIDNLKSNYGFLDDFWAKRLIRTYGTDAEKILANAESKTDLGMDFGASLTEIEVNWLIEKEFAFSSDDILWRRTKLGLRINDAQKTILQNYMIQKTVSNKFEKSYAK